MTRMSSRYSEATLRKAAVACLRNAESLHSSARLLVNHHRGAHAIALAIIGVEEFAKALVYAVAALRPDQRAALPPQITGHDLKHRIADWVETAVNDANEAASVVRDETGGGFTSWEWHVELLTYLAGRGLPNLSQRAAQAAREETNTFMKEWFKIMKRPVFMPAKKKEAALYVDLDENGCLSTPVRVENDAAQEVQTLAWHLRSIAALSDILEDDARWSDFVDAVRPRLGVSPALPICPPEPGAVL